jgi:hypothetical protein
VQHKAGALEGLAMVLINCVRAMGLFGDLKNNRFPGKKVLNRLAERQGV